MLCWHKWRWKGLLWLNKSSIPHSVPSLRTLNGQPPLSRGPGRFLLISEFLESARYHPKELRKWGNHIRGGGGGHSSVSHWYCKPCTQSPGSSPYCQLQPPWEKDTGTWLPLSAGCDCAQLINCCPSQRVVGVLRLTAPIALGVECLSLQWHG